MKTLNEEERKLFERDATQNCIAVGGACSNRCTFCSCKAQAAAGRKNWIKYITESDLLSVIDFINPDETIYFGEGPFFLSCEPFQHPNYVRLLEILNDFFPDTRKVCTTIGKNIKSSDYDLLKKFNINFVISINTFDKKLRKEVMKSRDDYNGLVNFLKECPELISKTSFMHYGDVDILKKDIDILHDIDPSYIEKESLLKLTDSSIFHNQETFSLYQKGKETWHDAVRYFDKSFSLPEYWLASLTDFPLDVKESFVLWTFNIHQARRDFLDRINRVEKLDIDLDDAAFLLPESSYDYFNQKFDYDNILVKNTTFGGSYKAAGLLSKNDIVKAVDRNKKKKYYITSKSIFGGFNEDLQGNHLKDYPINLILI